jgi:O-succinylbenzoic acid--CoA ligase
MADIPDSLRSAQFGNHLALIDSQRTLMYDQFDLAADILAEQLAEAGVRDGDRIALAEPNRLELSVVLFALFRLRAVACLFNIRQPVEALSKQADRIHCSRQITLDDTTVHIPKLDSITADTSGMNVHTTRDAEERAGVFDSTTPATIMFTSGTQSEPKAVLHSIGNHFFNALGSNANIAVMPGDRWLGSLPMYHVGGLAILFRCLLRGAAVVLTNPGDKLAEAIVNHRITHVSLVATQLQQMLDHCETTGVRFEHLKCILLGGGPTPEPLIERALKMGLPIYRSYGLTEMASQVATSSRSDATRTKVLDYREIRIDTRGEIFVRGETRFLGYVEGDRLVERFDKDGWFATGDTGRFDSDGLRITGRIDNMFISGGENIQPEQIEALLRIVPGVEDAVVVPIKDSKFGYRPVAFLKGEIPSRDTLVRHLEKHVPHYMIPVAFRRWPDEYLQTGIKPNRSFFRALLRQM